jgi:hypothetical protein
MGKYYTKLRKTRDTSSRLAEETGGYELMDLYSWLRTVLLTA